MTTSLDAANDALTADELDGVTGGIIIIGGHTPGLLRPVSPWEKVALNPQPLPPMPAPILALRFR